jgi:hypothetical protein
MRPAIVENEVASNMGIKYRGICGPELEPVHHIVTGMVESEVFSFVNIIMGSDALSLCLFMSCISSLPLNQRRGSVIKSQHIGGEVHDDGAYGRMAFSSSGKRR